MFKVGYEEIPVKKTQDIIECQRQYANYLSNKDGVELYFRGQTNAEWNIEPWCMRGKYKDSIEWVYKFKEESKGTTLFSQIAFYQHYHDDEQGTCFVDFSKDINVALFFACSNEEFREKDGALYIYSYCPHRAEAVETLLLTKLINMTSKEKMSISEFVEYVYGDKNITNKFDNKKDLESFLSTFLNHGYMVVPNEEDYLINLRLKKQQGVFYIPGLECESDEASESRLSSNAGGIIFFPHKYKIPNDLKNGLFLKKLIIDHSIKKEILDMLDRNHDINEKSLFPN